MGEPKTDLSVLLDTLLPFAEQMFAKYGEFIPAGLALTPSGEIIHISADPGPDVANVSQAAFELLLEGARAGAASGDYICTAIGCDVILAAPTPSGAQSALQVLLDHQQDYSAIAHWPYVAEDGTHDFEDMQIEEGNYSIFPRT